ncbi:MAG: protein kinase [Sandaracinaceae bacterium]|nr:protein kinase [Sandaracinaceae bacterium]
MSPNAPTPPDPFEAGEPTTAELVDGRYRLQLVRGRGAMGHVYEAWDVNLHRRVALKLAAPDAPPSDRERMEVEARAQASIRHRGVPVVHAFGRHDGRPYFVMELVRGPTLLEVITAHLAEGTSIADHRATAIALDVIAAVGAAHTADVLHRDIKAENVIIEAETGRVVLVDFGMATSRDRPVWSTPVGTPIAIAPEIWDGAPPSIASDVYALGCLVYELLTGRAPFAAESIAQIARAHGTRKPIPLGVLAPELAAYDAVLDVALAKDPSARFPTCAAFSAALEAVDPTRPPERAARGSDAIRVLVVEDDPLVARAAMRAATTGLEDAGVSVRWADTGERALRCAASEMPHVLVLDHQLPGWSGAETLSRMRSLPGGEDVAVIIVSGAISGPDEWRFSALGAATRVDKPFAFEDLVAAIRVKARARHWLPGGGSDTSRPPPGRTVIGARVAREPRHEDGRETQRAIPAAAARPSDER